MHNVTKFIPSLKEEKEKKGEKEKSIRFTVAICNLYKKWLFYAKS